MEVSAHNNETDVLNTANVSDVGGITSGFKVEDDNALEFVEGVITQAENNGALTDEIEDISTMLNEAVGDEKLEVAGDIVNEVLDVAAEQVEGVSPQRIWGEIQMLSLHSLDSASLDPAANDGMELSNELFQGNSDVPTAASALERVISSSLVDAG